MCLCDCVSVCLSVCRLLVSFNSWICKIMLHSRIMLSFAYAYLKWEEHVAKLVYQVLLLYLVVSSELAIGS